MVNIEKHLGLVHYLAKKYHKTCEEVCEYEDLVSAGYLGLCKAGINFDESLGFKFSSFAWRTILGEMKRAVFRYSNNFKRTAEGHERVYVNSLNERVGDTEESIEKIDLLVDCSNSYFDVDMQLMFDRFDEEEQRILDLYFNKNLTQVEIAKIFNISQAQICRKIRKCLNVLKEAI